MSHFRSEITFAPGTEWEKNKLQIFSTSVCLQCVEKVLDLHLSVFNQTLEAGKTLCETITDSEHQNQLQSELQALAETWKQSVSLLQGRRDLVQRTVQVTAVVKFVNIVVIIIIFLKGECQSRCS